MADEPSVMTVKEVAKDLRVTPNHVYKMVDLGEIPHLRLGGKILIPTKAYRAMLERAGA